MNCLLLQASSDNSDTFCGMEILISSAFHFVWQKSSSVVISLPEILSLCIFFMEMERTFI
jgi:hypothetical protein